MSLPPPDPGKHVARVLYPAAREFYDRLAAGSVATTRCPACELTGFPPRARCAGCGGPQEWVELPRRGTLHAFTTQERALRMTAPAVLALVELGGALLPALVQDVGYDELTIGQQVEVEPRAEPDTGLTILAARPA